MWTRAALLCLSFSLGWGCAEDANQPPQLLPIDDEEFRVNESGEITVRATDGDRDELGYAFSIDPPPITQTQGITARPTLTRISNNEALFTWTPGIADAGGGRSLDYRLTFEVLDERGAKDATTITVRVVNDGGVTQSAALRFIEPSGAGMAADLDESPCVEFQVRVKADQIAEGDVLLELLPPTPEGAQLVGAGPGKEKRFSWCPTDLQLNTSLSHLVEISARRVGGDERINKRFQIRFKRAAAEDCPGAPPSIQHTPPADFEGALNYEIEATISDDVGFKSPPALLYVIDPAEDPLASSAPDTSGWSLTNFNNGSGNLYTATIPNPGLAPGQEAQIFYMIIATDNDDPDGTRCDHSVESPIFSASARGGGVVETYGYCHACVADEQCGGPDDLCVDLGGEAFCVTTCAGGEPCAQGQQCVLTQSVDDRELSQCLPVDMNCGQRCTDDPFDDGARNDDELHATTLESGTYPGMTICGEDQDYFSFHVEPGQMVRARITFPTVEGDLDMLMALPGLEGPGGAPNYAYQSLSGSNDWEEVKEYCTSASGEALVWVTPYNHAQNTYELEIDIGPGDCDRICEDDLFDTEGLGNDDFASATSADPLPFWVNDQVLCPDDADVFAFFVEEGDLVSAAINFSNSEGNLDMVLYDGLELEIAGSYGFFDGELIETEATYDDMYFLMVFGATPSASALYTLAIQASDANACEETFSCPASSFCSDGGCADATCAHSAECGADHACASAQVGADPAVAGGQCVDACDNDFDCRVEVEYRCKRFEDFTTGCAEAGLGRVGSRCSGYQDCDGGMVCFPAPGGYCAEGGCAADLPCPEGTICHDGLVLGYSACVQTCADDSDCARSAEGYRCLEIQGGARACLPE